MTPQKTESHDAHGEKTGLLFGGLAVLFWSTSASFIVLGSSSMPMWTFVSFASLVAGLIQLAIHWGQRGKMRVCFLLPWRLWLGGILIFVVYGLVYPAALTISATSAQQLAVNLINYLWPVLTVLFSVLWVPGIVMTRRLGVAMLLAVGGLILANVASLREMLQGQGGSVLPFILGGIAAVTWGLYSCLLARWRAWANGYQTAPMGFLWIGVLAGGIAWRRGEWAFPAGQQWVCILAIGILTWGLGYMLWEKALHRARASTLGVLAATIPVTSTLLLCLVKQYAPAGTTLIAAGLMTVAVLLTVKRRNGIAVLPADRLD